jgi:glycosyltransferase involved in cell wall biosynthesis
LINADGSLQDAGGIVWRDGTVWNYGRGESPERPEFCYARRVDYCSGASIAVLASAWDQVGGFDFFYTPAYCEDLDLAFKLRRAGYEVWFQPLSLVLHYEGRSHGRDETIGIKAYQVRNLKTFYQRWRDTLAEHGLPHPFPHSEADRTRRQRVLVMDATTPTPDRDSGSVNTVELMRIFLHMGWHVAFVPRNHAFAGDYTRALQRVGVEPMIAPCIAHVGDIIHNRPQIYDAVFAFRLESLDDCYDKLRAAYPKARLIFHDIDLHHLRLKRRAEMLGDLSLQLEAEIIKDRELELFAKCDCSVVVTEAEKAMVQEQLPVENIVVYPYTIEVRRSQRPFPQRRHLCFIGGYVHDPNVDAVLYFVREIWPLVRSELPDDAKFLIVGPGAPESLLRLAAEDVVITGHVADLGELMDDCRLSVVPLRYGAGIKGKLVRSLAYGLPSVASSLAVEGMALQHGRHVLVADEPEAFAKAILTLYHNRQKWRSVQAAGYAFVEDNYSWKVGLETCERILQVAADTWISRRAAARQKRLAEILKGASEQDSKA